MPQLTADIEVGGNGLAYGFRQNWVDADGDDVEASLDCGAGVGSPWLILTLTDKASGKRHMEAVDVRTFLPGWIDAARERANADAD